MINHRILPYAVAAALFMFSCTDDDANDSSSSSPVFLLIDEGSIDNGIEPTEFSEEDVNDQLADIGLRTPLKYFQENIGKEINLYTGDVGDEAWFALKEIPASWIATGPTNNGLKNYLTPGPGLGGGGDDPEVLLDEIPAITPLRATGITMLKGRTIVAVVYDSDVSINYSPLTGNLMGSNLGMVAFDVVNVMKRNDGSSGSLPVVTIKIRNVTELNTQNLLLFANAPTPASSSEPFDVTPPTEDVEEIATVPAE